MREALALVPGILLAGYAWASAIAGRVPPFSLVILNPQTMRIGRLPEGWQVKVNRGTPDIQVVDGPSGGVVRLKSRNSSFGIERGVDVDVEQYPILTWKWKVRELPANADFRHVRSDDQAAQLLVAFADRRILSYIWDTSAPKGIMQSASVIPLLHIYAVVCRSGYGEADQWLSEGRNVAKDYEAAYGRNAPHVKGLRIQINTQHTATSAESYFSDVAFKAAP